MEKAFIENLELPHLKHNKLISNPSNGINYPDFLSGQEQLFVIPGALVGVKGDVTDAERMAILNCMQLANRGASAKFDRTKDLDEWYRFYFEILSKTGWVETSYSMSEYKSESLDITMDKVVLDVLLAAVDPEAGAASIATSLLNSAKNLNSGGSSEDEKSVTIYSNTSNTENHQNFQVGVAYKKDGYLNLVMGGFTFSTATQDIKILFFFEGKSSDINIKTLNNKLLFNSGIYDRLSNAIISKLVGSGETDFINNLDI